MALTWYDNFSEVRGPQVDCGESTGIQGDLKLDEVVFAAAYTGTTPNNMSKQNDPNGPFQNVQQTVTFDIDAVRARPRPGDTSTSPSTRRALSSA